MPQPSGWASCIVPVYLTWQRPARALSRKLSVWPPCSTENRVEVIALAHRAPRDPDEQCCRTDPDLPTPALRAARSPRSTAAGTTGKVDPELCRLHRFTKHTITDHKDGSQEYEGGCSATGANMPSINRSVNHGICFCVPIFGPDRPGFRGNQLVHAQDERLRVTWLTDGEVDDRRGPLRPKNK